MANFTSNTYILKRKILTYTNKNWKKIEGKTARKKCGRKNPTKDFLRPKIESIYQNKNIDIAIDTALYQGHRTKSIIHL